MAVTVEALKRKIAHLQEELAEVSAALDELGNGAAEATSETEAPKRNPLAGLRFSDPAEILPILDRAFAEMGIDVNEPAMTPEEVQELMLREGVRPEENIGSRDLIEAREALLSIA